MAELYIIPECYVDTNLIETLVPTAKGYNHQKGCNNVVKVMKEKLSDKFAVGIVDKDARLCIARRIDMKIVASACDASAHKLAIVLEVHRIKRNIALF